MYIFLAVAILALTPPLTGVAIILFGLQYPPRIRSTLALGYTFLLAAFALTLLGTGSALIDGQQPFVPYWLITGLPAGVVARMMQRELYPI